MNALDTPSDERVLQIPNLEPAGADIDASWLATSMTHLQGTRVIEDSRRLRMASWSDKGREGGR